MELSHIFHWNNAEFACVIKVYCATCLRGQWQVCPLMSSGKIFLKQLLYPMSYWQTAPVPHIPKITITIQIQYYLFIYHSKDAVTPFRAVYNTNNIKKKTVTQTWNIYITHCSIFSQWRQQHWDWDTPPIPHNSDLV